MTIIKPFSAGTKQISVVILHLEIINYLTDWLLSNINITRVSTVYGKTFEGENFCGFRGFLANRESFPLESFAVYST